MYIAHVLYSCYGFIDVLKTILNSLRSWLLKIIYRGIIILENSIVDKEQL